MRCLQSRPLSHLRKRFPGCVLSYDRVRHWIAELLPLVKAAQQRTHMADAVLSELQRRPGAGRFVWSSAEQHDFAVAGDLAVPAFQFFRRNLQRSWQSARVA